VGCWRVIARRRLVWTPVGFAAAGFGGAVVGFYWEFYCPEVQDGRFSGAVVAIGRGRVAVGQPFQPGGTRGVVPIWQVRSPRLGCIRFVC
jgi:hypothetical protein